MTSVVRTFAVRYALPTDYRFASSRRGPRLFSSSIITLNGLGLDDARGVTFLPVLGLGGDGPRDVARAEPESGSQRSQCGNQNRDDNFPDVFVAHNGLFFVNFWTDLLFVSWITVSDDKGTVFWGDGQIVCPKVRKRGEFLSLSNNNSG